jgi:hypothetical protein
LIAEAGIGSVLAIAAAAASREVAWRRAMREEIAPEVGLGIVGEADYRALGSFRRFGRIWRADAGERRTLRVLAASLVRAKRRVAAGDPRRRDLFQVEVLTLRTRLRKFREASEAGGD